MRTFFKPPAHSVDAHVHVFGPVSRFPYAPERKYTPAREAPREALAALHASLGLDRVVVVQATCHGTDNRAMLDALAAWGDRARGVAVVSPSVDDATLHHLHAAGVRGLRYVMLSRLVDAPDWAALQVLARRIAPLGWHVELYVEAEQIMPWWHELMALPVPLVLDHMGRPDVRAGLDGAGFQAVLRLLAERPDTWVKLSCPERLSHSGPWAQGTEPRPYQDVLPLAQALAARHPGQVLWGTDWPHPNMHTHTPDDASLLNWVPLIAPTLQAQQALLVDNPQRLYWSN